MTGLKLEVTLFYTVWDITDELEETCSWHMHTLVAALLTLFERFLGVFFWNHSQEACHVGNDLFSHIKLHRFRKFF
jgi:hypothetical protein